MRTGYSIVLLLLLALPALAQERFVSGRVVEAGTEVPIVGASIVAGNVGVATGANGQFRIRVREGVSDVVVSALGYARETVAIGTGELEIQLRALPLEMGEVVVARSTLSRGRQTDLPGAVYVLGPRDLNAFRDGDANRILRQVPGISLQEEDGMGLRMNIGLRGTGSERSSKVTIMEDGVLVAPAPYAAPAAYYFPTVGRMGSLEVRTGSSQIAYGPITTGGVVNLLSTPVPYHTSGFLSVQGGSWGGRQVHAYGGTRTDRVGVLVETFQWGGTGFKRVDGNPDADYRKQDYLAKVQFTSRPGARVYQSLLVKGVWAKEDSDETYVGLTAADFRANPVRRYASTQLDNIATENQHVMARYVVQPMRGLDVTLTGYATEFSRNWYKLDAVRAPSGRASLANTLNDPIRFADQYAILAGADSPNDNAIELKSNRRVYQTAGVQGVIGWQARTGAFAHDVEAGLRLHRDDEDRFQEVDFYRMRGGMLELTQRGIGGSDANRITTAEATAVYAQYRLSWGRIAVTPGVRHETIRFTTENYGRTDPDRAGSALVTTKNRNVVLIPGVGVHVQVVEGVGLFGGVHKGFAPGGATVGANPEESLNTEIGVRYQSPRLAGQVVAYVNDYTNLLGADLTAAGGTGTGDLFNGGAVLARGVEVSASTDVSRWISLPVRAPVSVTYTFTQAEFRSAFQSTFGPWGSVQVGDRMPYTPEHQMHVRAGVQGAWGQVNVSGTHIGAIRTQAGQGAFSGMQRIDAHTVLDVAASVPVNRRVDVFASVRNVLDATYAVANRPAGLRPGLPRTFTLGLTTSL